MKKILLADDHLVVREGLRTLLSKILTQPELFDAFNEISILEKLAERIYDLVIMDVNMPGVNTILLMRDIKNKYPNLKVLIFSMNSDKLYARRFLKEGASGFISKDAPVEEFKKAIHSVIEGEIYYSSTVANDIINNAITGTISNPFDRLSKREFEISSMLLEGRSSDDISKSLNLSPSTVGTHKGRILEKLNVENIIGLKELAIIYQA